MINSTLQISKFVLEEAREGSISALEGNNWAWLRDFYTFRYPNGIEIVIETVVTGVQGQSESSAVDVVYTVAALGGYGLYATTSEEQAARRMSALVDVLGGW